MGESDQLVRTQKLKEVGKSDDFPEFKKGDSLEDSILSFGGVVSMGYST